MNNEQMKLLRMMWGMFIASIGIYGFLGYQHITQESKSFLWEVKDLQETNFLVVAILSIVILTAAQILRRRPGGQAFILQLLQFALSETPAIMGLVLIFTEGTITQMGTLCAASLASLLLLVPKDSPLEPPQPHNT